MERDKGMADRIRTLVVDDHHVVRQGLVALLKVMPEIEIVGEASDGLQAIELHRSLQPDITLMDLQLPNLGGVAAITRIRAEAPGARFIVLTTFDGDEDIYRALQAGAKAYLLKGMTIDDLLSTIRLVHAGKTSISPAIAEKLAERMSTQDLTARELAVLERIVAGRANKEIASDLAISEATVKTHVGRILAKLGLRDRVQIVVFAYEHGLVTPAGTEG